MGEGGRGGGRNWVEGGGFLSQLCDSDKEAFGDIFLIQPRFYTITSCCMYSNENACISIYVYIQTKSLHVMTISEADQILHSHHLYIEFLLIHVKYIPILFFFFFFRKIILSKKYFSPEIIRL